MIWNVFWRGSIPIFTGSCDIGLYLSITILNGINLSTWNGLVKNPTNTPSVGFTSFLSSMSLTNKYIILLCRQFPVNKFLPFLSIRTALWLYRYILLSLILYPCYSKNIINHMLYGKYSIIRTSSASVKLLLFIFYFNNLICISFVPK